MKDIKLLKKFYKNINIDKMMTWPFNFLNQYNFNINNKDIYVAPYLGIILNICFARFKITDKQSIQNFIYDELLSILRKLKKYLYEKNKLLSENMQISLRSHFFNKRLYKTKTIFFYSFVKSDLFTKRELNRERYLIKKSFKIIIEKMKIFVSMKVYKYFSKRKKLTHLFPFS